MKLRTFGFTLIELILVIALVGILSAVAIPRIYNYKQEAMEATTKQLLSNIRTAIQNWRANQIVQNGNNIFPGTTEIYAVLEGGSESSFPNNPYNQHNTIFITVDNEFTSVRSIVTEGNFGWVYNNLDGTFYANSNSCIASDASCTTTANDL